MFDATSRFAGICAIAFSACTAPSRATSGRVPRAPPPVAAVPAVDPEIDLQSFASWKDLGTAIVRAGGEQRIAIVARTPAGGSPETVERSRKIVLGQLADRVRELAGRALGVDAESLEMRVFEPTREHRERGTIYVLLVCDAQCFETYASDPKPEFFGRVIARLRDELREADPSVGPEIARMRIFELAFADLDRAKWKGSGPWWIGLQAEIVPYDGAAALIAVGSSPGGECTRERREEALDEARRRLATAFAERVLHRASGDPITSMHHARDAGGVEYEGRCFVLLVCTSDCLVKSADQSGTKLPDSVPITYE